MTVPFIFRAQLDYFRTWLARVLIRLAEKIQPQSPELIALKNKQAFAAVPPWAQFVRVIPEDRPPGGYLH